MIFKRLFFIIAVCLTFINFSAYSGGPKKPAATSGVKSGQWVPVNNHDWSVYMGAPEYHFSLAKEYLQKGDKEKASSELKRGNSFLIFQMNRLSLASKQIEELSNSILTAQNSPPANFDTATANALKVIDSRFAMVPVNVGWTTDFEEAYKYHFDRAKLKLQEKDRAKAALEINLAASFMELEAAYSGVVARAELDNVRSELRDLASKVQSGAVKEIKDLKQVFQKAMAVVSKKN
ncbi:MAG: hypothetical protein JW913_16755 [Chitinispirillaceae bacterium]|nr:hypothetical protein [Chitinispirillaceae bacterium]